MSVITEAFGYTQSDNVRSLILDAQLALIDVRSWANFNSTSDEGLEAATQLFEAVKKIKEIAEGAVNASP